MILYLSTATAYDIYNRQFLENKIIGGYQSQKFNHNLMMGLSKCCELTAISNLPYGDIKEEKIEEVHNGIKFIVTKNSKGIIRKPMNLFRVIYEGIKLIRKKNIECIICDAFSLTPNYATKVLSNLFRIPKVAIVTDLPDINTRKIKMMHGFDGYVILTEAMNEVVNPLQKPYVLMEGICAEQLPEIVPIEHRKRTLLYTGALWKLNAGIEYLIDGFIKAQLHDYELHFYGTGELVPWICEMEKMHSQIKYKGCVTNDEIVQKQCEATLLINPRPSDQEFCKYSFPSKIMEYMSSATPVLTTKLPGIPDEYFDYCFTIDDETADGIAKKLQQILEGNQLYNVGLNGRSFVVTNKNCEYQGKRIYDVIIQCCRNI